jgi:PKD repeat protein
MSSAFCHVQIRRVDFAMIRSTHLLMLRTLVVISVLIARPALAVPLPPATFWGTLTLDGAPAPDGSILRALIQNVEFASTTVFSRNGQQGLYVIDIPADDPNTPDVPEGGQPGQIITFAIDGAKIGQTAIWKVGNAGNVNLLGNPTTSPVANFICLPRAGPVPLIIRCTDTSTGSPNAWFWTFGDGANSTTQNPVYTYNSIGAYNIGLTASNASGTDLLIRPNYILVYTLTPTNTPQIGGTPSPDTPTNTPIGGTPSPDTPTNTPPTATAINEVTSTPTVTSITTPPPIYLPLIHDRNP